MAAFGFFLNAALTTPVTSLVVEQDVSGGTPPVSFQIYLGSTSPGATLRTLVNPGVDQINVYTNDSTPGTGALPSQTKLAATQAGLVSAVAGASLNLGTVITGGVANAVSFWYQVSDTTGVQGVKTDLSLKTNVLGEL